MLPSSDTPIFKFASIDAAKFEVSLALGCADAALVETDTTPCVDSDSESNTHIQSLSMPSK